MGKHERDWADAFGKDIVNYFNDNSLESTLAVKRGAEEVFIRFPNADRLTWDGDDNYEIPGDIGVYSNNTLIARNEFKSSKSNGTGTSANVSQGFFEMWFKNGIGYTKWEKQDGVWDQRWEIVEQLTGIKPTNQTHYQDLCRKLKTNKQLDPIVEITNKKKSEYAQCIRGIVEKEPKRMAHLLHILRLGRHTIPAIKEALNKEVFDTPRSILVAQYVDSNPQFSWDKKASSIDDEICSIETTNGGIMFHQHSGQEARFQIHWKNIAQGVKTPCFNVWY